MICGCAQLLNQAFYWCINVLFSPSQSGFALISDFSARSKSPSPRKSTSSSSTAPAEASEVAAGVAGVRGALYICFSHISFIKTSLTLQHLLPQAKTRTGTRDITATGTRDMGTKAMAVTVASRAMAATVAMAATTIPLHTMVDMVVVMITVCLYLPDTHDRSGVPSMFTQSHLSSFFFSSDQGSASYGKTPRRGGHQSSYKPY